MGYGVLQQNIVSLANNNFVSFSILVCTYFIFLSNYIGQALKEKHYDSVVTIGTSDIDFNINAWWLV